MGIKTKKIRPSYRHEIALKNLPTTWGLRLISFPLAKVSDCSEKPPHHMGIKTPD